MWDLFPAAWLTTNQAPQPKSKERRERGGGEAAGKNFGGERKGEGDLRGRGRNKKQGEGGWKFDCSAMGPCTDIECEAGEDTLTLDLRGWRFKWQETKKEENSLDWLRREPQLTGGRQFSSRHPHSTVSRNPCCWEAVMTCNAITAAVLLCMFLCEQFKPTVPLLLWESDSTARTNPQIPQVNRSSELRWDWVEQIFSSGPGSLYSGLD